MIILLVLLLPAWKGTFFKVPKAKLCWFGFIYERKFLENGTRRFKCNVKPPGHFKLSNINCPAPALAQPVNERGAFKKAHEEHPPEKFQRELSWMARRTCGMIQKVLTSTHIRNVLLALCDARRGSKLHLYCRVSTLQNWVHLPLESHHPKPGNHMTIK